MGTSTAYQLALRGQAVLGIDQFSPPHSFGSSHGKSRIIRETYFEDPLYVPFVKRAYNGWAELQARSGKRVLTRTGGLMIGAPDGAVVSGARASAVEHRLPYEELSAGELRDRFPALRPPDDAAARLVISAGPWMGDLVPELALPLEIERNAVYWFDPLKAAEFTPDKLPVFIHEYAPGHTWYGFANFGDGVKVALHHQGELTTAQAVRRAVSDSEVAGVRGLLKAFLPDANGALRATSVCLYTNTPDENFILDVHPEHPAVFIASPCSGHGFKFSIAIGEAIADVLMGERRRFDLSPFSLARFARP